jgi:hypothetical protein
MSQSHQTGVFVSSHQEAEVIRYYIWRAFNAVRDLTRAGV